jgi:exosortase/archaeosortase
MEQAIKLGKLVILVMVSALLAVTSWCVFTLEQDLELVHWKIATIDTAKLNDVVDVFYQKVAAVDVVKLNAVIVSADNTLAHTDAAIVLVRQQLDQLDPRTLNTIALHIDRVVGHVDQASHDEVAQQRDVSKRTLQVLDSTDQAVKQLAPVMSQLLADLVEANRTLEQSTGTMANVNHTTAQIDHKVTQMLQPAAFMRRMGEQAASAGAKFLNWWRAFH